MPFQSSARGKYGAQSMKPTKGPLAPVWSTSGTIGNNIAQGSAYSFQVTATDDSGDTPTYSFGTGSLPTGISVSSSGLVSGTPSNSGTFNFTVNATDANGRTTASPTLTISVQNPLKQPQIWYKNSRVGQSPITNDGTFGTGYNTPANPSTTTDSGRNVWNMGSSYFEFPSFNITPYANGYAAWTFAVVMRTSANMQKWSLLGSPTGASQIVGAANRASNQFEISYNNDGYPWPGATVMGNIDTTSNMCQVVIRYDGITYNGSGRLQVWGPSRTSGAIYDNYLSNGQGFNYTSQIDHNRVGWSRGSQDGTWYLAEYLFYQGVVTDAEITQIRSYLGSTHPVGVVNN
jgi:hypothetical protein